MATQPIDLLRPTARTAEVSQDRKYLEHEFVTYQGGTHWSNGWTAGEARDAISAHLKGTFFSSATLARDVRRFPPIMGALRQRIAPARRCAWQIDGPTRAPGRFAVDDQKPVLASFLRLYREVLLDVALMGFCWLHHHLEVDAKTGILRPVLRRWPLETVTWRARTAAFEEGYYASTLDGLVRMVHGDGHWTLIGSGQRPHEMGAILALGLSYVAGELSRRDRAGLSEAAGRASPVAELPKDITPESDKGKDTAQVVSGLGRARKGALLPYGVKLSKFEVVSDTKFFEGALKDELGLVALSLLGQAGTLAPGSGGVYTPPVFEGVAESLVDDDVRETEQGYTEGLARTLTAINYADVDADSVRLLGARPNRDDDARLKARGERSLALGTIVKAWRDAGLEPTQENVDKLAGDLGLPSIPIGEKKEPTGPAGALVTVGSAPTPTEKAPVGAE